MIFYYVTPDESTHSLLFGPFRKKSSKGYSTIFFLWAWWINAFINIWRLSKIKLNGCLPNFFSVLHESKYSLSFCQKKTLNRYSIFFLCNWWINYFIFVWKISKNNNNYMFCKQFFFLCTWWFNKFIVVWTLSKEYVKWIFYKFYLCASWINATIFILKFQKISLKR